MDDSKPDQKSTLTRESVLIALEALSRELGKHSVHGEMCLFGGTVMMLAMGARVLGALGPVSDGARHGDSNTALLCSPVLQGRFLLMSFKMKILNVASAIMFAAALMVSPLTQSAQAQCSADLNDDHEVDGLDLAAMLSAWGTSGGSTGADINGDSIVDGPHPARMYPRSIPVTAPSPSMSAGQFVQAPQLERICAKSTPSMIPLGMTSPVHCPCTEEVEMPKVIATAATIESSIFGDFIFGLLESRINRKTWNAFKITQLCEKSKNLEFPWLWRFYGLNVIFWHASTPISSSTSSPPWHLTSKALFLLI